MHLAIINFEFYLHGCQSLKEKRRRLAGLREKFGKNTGIAVCESDRQDHWQESQWSFAIMALDKRLVEKQAACIESHCRSHLDAELCHIHLEWL